MEEKLFDILDDLNISDTKFLLDKDINLSIDSSTRKRIEKSIKKKAGYYNEGNIIMGKINNILGGILMKKKIALALSAAIILSLSGGGYAYAKSPVAYVSVDINPSVELGVNAFDKVVSVEAYNEDGQKILEGTNLVNYDIGNAVSTVISNAISDGYITQDVTTTSAVVVEITTSTDKDKVGTKLEKSLKDVADETLNENDIEAEVGTEKVALARRDEARKLGITPGKLNLIQKLQALDPEIKVEDYKDSSVKDIQKKTKELRKNNKSNEVTTDESTNTDVVADENTQEETLSGASVDSEQTTIVKPEKNNNSHNNKDNNGNAKKEENINIDSNSNSKKEENSNGNKEKNTTIATPEKQEDSNTVKSQGNSNSSKLENSSNSDSESKSKSNNNNSSKSENSGNSNSNSQNKGKGKNN